MTDSIACDRLKADHNQSQEYEQAVRLAQYEAQRAVNTARARMKIARTQKEQAYDDMQYAWQVHTDAQRMINDEIEQLSIERLESDWQAKQLRREASRTHRGGNTPSPQCVRSFATQRRSLLTQLHATHERFIAHRDTFSHAARIYRLRERAFYLAKDRLRETNRILAQYTGVPETYLDEVYVMQKSDGVAHIYFGGINHPIGPEHGHYVVDQHGGLPYMRDPFKSRGPHNFTSYASHLVDDSCQHTAEKE